MAQAGRDIFSDRASFDYYDADHVVAGDFGPSGLARCHTASNPVARAGVDGARNCSAVVGPQQHSNQKIIQNF